MNRQLRIAFLLFLLLIPAGIPAQEVFQRWNFETGMESWGNSQKPDSGASADRNGNARSGKGCIRLASTGKPGTRVFTRLQDWRIGTLAGRRFTFNAFVKGKGNFRSGFLVTSWKNGKITVSKELGKTFAATPQYRVYSSPIDLSRTGRVFRIYPVIVLEGEGELFVDDAVFMEQAKEKRVFETARNHIVLRRGMPAPRIEFTSPGDAAVFQIEGTYCTAERYFKEPGKFVFVPETGKSDSLLIRAASGGSTCDVRINEIPEADYDRTDALAKKIRLEKPLRILYLGDSLTDFCRGFNYADKINFWLNRCNPGKASFRNAGVGGDFITRTFQRLKGIDGKRKAFRQSRYNGLWDDSYDLVFLWLGHNDTVSNSRWDKELKKPRISSEIQKNEYAETIKEIRKHTRAPIVLVSSASSDYDSCCRFTEKMKRPDGMKYRFGNPELLEEWNRNLKKIAAEQQVGFLDLYSRMKSHPEKMSFYSPADGVHPNEKGYTFLAECFLKYLSEKK